MSEAKRLAGEKAIEYVEDGMIVGVGTGSTVAYFIDALARVKDRIKGTVSSSEQSTARLRAHGIEVVDAAAVDRLVTQLLEAAATSLGGMSLHDLVRQGDAPPADLSPTPTAPA